MRALEEGQTIVSDSRDVPNFTSASNNPVLNLQFLCGGSQNMHALAITILKEVEFL